MKWNFDFLGLNNLQTPPEEELPERNGVLRYVQVLWDHLGKLLLANILCFVGFLPAALGISLGLIYESFWLTLLGGVLGGMIAAPFWTAMLHLALRCYQDVADEWFRTFRWVLLHTLTSATAQGAVLGGVAAGLLSVGHFCSGLIEEGILPALPVWLVLALDFILAAMAASLLFPPLCFQHQCFPERLRTALSMLAEAPVRMLAAGLALLLWCTLGVSLFPVSVPFAVVLGFWPVALLTVQVQRPILLERFNGLETAELSERNLLSENKYTLGQRGEIWWRRHWVIVVAVVICASLGLGVVRTFATMQEPDLQIAFVHSELLPDEVHSALESSFQKMIGDLNGDGAAIVQINDYQVAFDGNIENVDVQAAASTLLVTDIAGNESCLFIVEDVDGFLTLYGDQVDTENARSWGDYPVLTALDAGTYCTVADISTKETGQALLADYTVLPRLNEAEALAYLEE